jgi:2-polyprenyl-6-methoxyphenol hydroxylase-like FAD-dependent oxidoreductase
MNFDAQIRYRWVNADGRTLIEFPHGVPSASGFLYGYMMYQPVLDDALYAAVERAGAKPEVHMGWEITGIEELDDGVLATAHRRTRDQEGLPVLTSEVKRIRASYVIAADGAGSSTRSILGIEREDLGFSEQWLVVDARLNQPVSEEFRSHERANQVTMVCDPSRPGMSTPLGLRHRRWEFMLLPGESIEEFERPEKAWELLAGSRVDLPEWPITQEHIDIKRQVVYRFEGKIAKSWRRGRTFLAGDAAHTMPPHMGQGLCSGLGDIANLAWKLDLVLSGSAGEELLESYEVERAPHARSWIEISMAVGAIACTLDPEAAAVRDAALLRGEPPQIPLMPHIVGGVLDVDQHGTPIAPAGQIFLQAEVESSSGRGLFHDAVGQGFMVVSGAGDPRVALGQKQLDLLDSLGTTYAWVSEIPGDGGGFVDIQGSYANFFRDKAAVIVRPDYHVYGGVRRLEDLPRLVDGLAGHLMAKADHKEMAAV